MARPSAWWGFAYNALFSQFLGFFAWYRGLAIGGIARVGQVQLLQAFITIAAAALLFGEAVDLRTILFAAAVGSASTYFVMEARQPAQAAVQQPKAEGAPFAAKPKAPEGDVPEVPRKQGTPKFGGKTGGGARLTPLGDHYRRLVVDDRI